MIEARWTMCGFVLPPTVRYRTTAYETAQGADALSVVTEWNEFKHLDLLHLKALMQQPIVIDGRNLYAPHVMATHGSVYRGIGRRVGEGNTTSPIGVHPAMADALV